MSSDLCKIVEEPQKCPDGQTWDPKHKKCVKEKEKPIHGCMDRTSLNYNPKATVDDGSCKYDPTVPRNQSLRSKHLHIVSSDLVFDAKAAPNLPASVRRERRAKEKKDIRIGGDDRVRIEFFRHYVASDTYMSEQYPTTAGKFIPSISPAEVVYDILPGEEKLAYDLLIGGGLEGEVFAYINFSLDVPFNEKEVEANSVYSGRTNQDDPGFQGADPRISTYKFEPRYNFYQKKYEAKVNNKDVDERAIPSAHMFSFLAESLTDRDVRNFDENYLDYLAYSVKNEPLLQYNLATKKYSFARYQSKYITRPDVVLSSDYISEAQLEKFNNQVVTQDDIVEYSRITEGYRGTANYGFYLEIPFEPPSSVAKGEEEKSDFKNIFKITNTDLNLYNIVIKTNNTLGTDTPCGKLLQEFKNMTPDEKITAYKGVSWSNFMDGRFETICGDTPESRKPFQEAYKLPDPLRDFVPTQLSCYTQTSYIQATTNTPSLNFSEIPSEFQSWDLTDFFTDYEQMLDNVSSSLKSVFNLADDDNSVILGETNEAIQKYSNNAVYDWFQTLMNKVANYQFKTLIKNNGIKNAFSLFGKQGPLATTPHETLFYKIVKKGPPGSNLKQNFYLANPSEEDQFGNKLLKFFDTQVKYDTSYSYDVFAYPLVLGKKYRYEIDESGDYYHASMRKINKLKIIASDYIPLLEVPLFSVDGRILDAPPVAPKVSFVPFKDRDDQLMIKLKGESTSYYEIPQAINEEDVRLITALVNSRGTDKKGRLFYSTDDYASRFEIYRMDTKPKSYRDFSGNLRKKAELKERFSAFNFLDKITTNKKYYYTFRSLDAHNNFSNPSPVYEFILNDDGGFLFPEVRIIDFEDTDYFDFSTKMEKYIQIKPSAQNIILNPELIKNKKSGKDLMCEIKESSPPPLGIASNPVWGKNFKLRITSKTSGKKVDINFAFSRKHKKVKKDEE
jgi:hypothetical protein